ncbi:MAG: aldo/keto reductase, partial [Anaerolineales bacterium]
LPSGLRARFAPGLSDAQRALQFARSAPGVTAALAGMSRAAHVEENLGLRDLAPMTAAEFAAVFAS